jgi:hypothetical protein
MPQARPIRLWAANAVSTMSFSFSSTRDHRVLVAIRKDGLAPQFRGSPRKDSSCRPWLDPLKPAPTNLNHEITPKTLAYCVLPLAPKPISAGSGNNRLHDFCRRRQSRSGDHRTAHRAADNYGDVESIHESRPARLGQHHPDLQSLHLVQDRRPAMVVDSVDAHPFVNFIILIILCIDTAKSFGKGAGFGIGLALLGVIFWPILGFGSAQYQGAAATPRI